MKRVIVSTFLILLVFSMSNGQLAQTGNKGLLRTHSAQMLGKGVLGINTAAYLSLDNEFVKNGIVLVDDATPKYAYNPKGFESTYISTYYSIAYGFTNYIDVNATLPFYVDNTNIGDNGMDNGIGDLTLSMKFQYPPYPHSKIFSMTYFGELSIPTATKGKGLFPRQPYYTRAQNIKPGSLYRYVDPVDSLNFPITDSARLYDVFDSLKENSLIPSEDFFYGTKSPSFLAKMLWTLDIAEIDPDIPLKWNLNFGALFAGNAKSDNIFVLGSSLEWTPHELITLFTDFYGEARFSQLAASFDLGKEPLILGSGLSFHVPGGAHLTVAFDKCFSLNNKYSTIYYNPEKKQAYQTKIFPDIGISIGLSWNGSIRKQYKDSDGDGIPDHLDACPDEPEDIDGFEDYDGCPDYDNDRDGILDIRDKCPNEPEDFDGFEDLDGCPDYDNDKDGIPDVSDKCPNEPEDLDGFEDKDGCPDHDNDMDGIPDSLDKCPNDPEDFDGFEDTDGCPEYDNDKDGIPDSLDKCPNQPENFNGFQDDDGCPDVKVEAIKPKIVLEGVNFKTGSAELTFESFAILDKQIESLVAFPDVCIEIRGHTDNVGKRESNISLSLDRAASVRTYMLSKGVAPTRVTAVGKGPDEPIDDNRKADGRAKNRRIEMYRVNCR